MSRRSLLLQLLVPPPFEERLSERHWASGNRLRALMIASALLVDAALWWLLAGSAVVDQDVLTRFVAINLSLLGADLLVSLHLASSPRWRRMWLLHALMVVEVFTTMVWVQATGTLSSYFALLGSLLIVLYRAFVGFAAGVTVLVALCTLHLGAVTLESAGLLTPEPLWRASPSVLYGVVGYQVAAALSIVSAYAMSFAGANAIVSKLREKDRALAEVRAEVAQIAEEVRHGRFSGSLIDDRYALGELLGRGGMGEIYLARRLADDRQVAVKILHPHLVSDPVALSRFRREADAAQRLPVAATAEILEVGASHDRQLDYIAMEYLRGEDLGAYLRRRGRLDPDETLALARDIGAILEAAHAADVVHRDLKPQNIFLVDPASGQPRVRLLDFGMSKVLEREDQTLTRAHAVIGTLGYMAPEQLLGDSAEAGPEADLYALAAVCYRALVGHAPYRAGTVVEAVRELLTTTPEAPTRARPELHSHVDAFFRVALARRPEQRYGSAAVFVGDLEDAFAGRLPPAKLERAGSLASGFAHEPTLEHAE